MQRKFKSLNGYHDDIIEALRTAALNRPSSATPASSSSEDLLRRSLAAAMEHGYKRALSQDKLCDGSEYTSALPGTYLRFEVCTAIEGCKTDRSM